MLWLLDAAQEAYEAASLMMRPAEEPEQTSTVEPALMRTIEDTSKVKVVAFFNDSRRVVTGSSDSTL